MKTIYERLKNVCLCSKKLLDKTEGQLFEMILNKDGTYHDECRLCHKTIVYALWNKYHKE